MKYTKLGNSDLNVSRICMGCMGFGDAGRGQHSWTLDEAHSREIIRRGLEMGVNFSDYINRQRIEYAARMMREHPEQPINELYIKTGFSSSSAFYRNFRHYMGCTPKEYVEKSKF